ncbi:Crp/Fnr family transcriptional regulator [Xanthomarina sp. F2636L]|uniref:Crp/Fnr family transcriptional regulator n=1 Tax=Xanthomarina sp. F2636L TaxID=2996018 RepID=UPI00225E4FB6|nr:Crp/Fnr family transcriptional regulator [Xanthomarina sp. F2636L]MCX7550334.1 Crp/Fnr family transcriptional regulator [Xanthomarina sp. F2636L]
MIPSNILETYNPILKTFSKGEIVFNETEIPKYYYQLKSGKIKMFNLTEDGKEFTQGFFDKNTSFGEPPLFGSFAYPASAMCLTDCEVYILKKNVFLNLLKAQPDIHLKFTKLLCNRMLYKAKIMKELSIHPPEHRILTLLHHLKDSAKTEDLFEVKLTRKQISDLTGLRVETVIRTIKHLEKTKKLILKQRKVFI